MPSFNQVFLVGHLTRDPEFRTVGDKQTPLCSFGVAWSDKPKKQGDQPKAHFFDCQCWQDLAEEVATEFRKGDAIAIHGRLDFQQWDDKTSGQKRSKVAVVASIVSKPVYRVKEGAMRQSGAKTPPPQNTTAEGQDENLPF